jgi:SHS family lactate transporter-like MFS transporter
MLSFRWWRDLTAEQRRAFLAAYLGWMLDGFDFYMFVFLIPDVQATFQITRTAAGIIGTATLLSRVVGGIAAGSAADRWGRKPVLAGSIVWYSAFAALGGFAPSYLLLLVLRSAFGLGMGAAWSAGLPLTLEHWPAHLRGVASGLLQGGYSAGVVLSALVYSTGCAGFDCHANEHWRVFLWLGLAPAAVGLWVMTRVTESPLWRSKSANATFRAAVPSADRRLPPGYWRVVAQTFALVGAFQMSYQAMSFWYPTMLANAGRSPLLFVCVVNIAGIAGAALWGRLSETRLGRRRAVSLAMGLGVLAAPLYVFGASIGALVAGALIMGLFAAGALGVVPGYLAERFPTAFRGTGMAAAYHSGAALGALVPYLIGRLQDAGLSLPFAMGTCIVTGGVLMIVAVWSGPETRGRDLHET